MGLDRGQGDIQRSRDLFIRSADRHSAQYLALSVRQRDLGQDVLLRAVYFSEWYR